MFLACLNSDNYQVLSNGSISVEEIMDFTPEEEIRYLIHVNDITEEEARMLVAERLGAS